MISFDEFINLHRKYQQVLWPVFHMQDAIQERTLGRETWRRIAREVSKRRRIRVPQA